MRFTTIVYVFYLSETKNLFLAHVFCVMVFDEHYTRYRRKCRIYNLQKKEKIAMRKKIKNVQEKNW